MLSASPQNGTPTSWGHVSLKWLPPTEDPAPDESNHWTYQIPARLHFPRLMSSQFPSHITSPSLHHSRSPWLGTISPLPLAEVSPWSQCLQTPSPQFLLKSRRILYIRYLATTAKIFTLAKPADLWWSGSKSTKPVTVSTTIRIHQQVTSRVLPPSTHGKKGMW